MSEAQQLARRQQQVEELCAGAIRALSGEADLHFRGRRLHRGRQRLPLFAPHLHPAIESDDFGSFRGAADGLALRLSLSDAALHAQSVPRRSGGAPGLRAAGTDARGIARAAGLRGVAHNLRHRFEQWSLAFHRSRLTDSARGILLYTVAQVCRARVTGEPVLEETEDLMEATRAALAPAHGQRPGGPAPPAPRPGGLCAARAGHRAAGGRDAAFGRRGRRWRTPTASTPRTANAPPSAW